MTYSPGNPGYQPAQPPGPYGGLNPSFAKAGDSISKVPLYLQAVVVALGFATYLASFGPMLTASDNGTIKLIGHVGLAVPLAVVAGLLAAVGLLPKAKNYTPIVAVVAVSGALLAITRTVTKGDNYSIGWALWLVLSFTIVQAAVAVAGLLLDAGVVTAPAPRPKYDPYAQYGLAPGGGYYGQPGQPVGHRGPPQQPGYPSYGGYPPGPMSGGFGAPSGPSTGGFGVGPQRSEPQGPPTPPTGFPSFGSPTSGGSASGGGQGTGSANSGQGEDAADGQSSSSSASSGPTPS